MNFELAEEHRMLQDLVRRFVDEELMPLEAVKGAAIRRFMEQPAFAGRSPVFLGDDTSDESGFDVINEMDGVSVRIRPRGPTAAGRPQTALAETAATSPDGLTAALRST